MREILYKAKRLDNGEWVEGAFCRYDCPNPFGAAVEMPSIIKYGEPHSLFWFKVDPETVRQYTGFVDKNGLKIFEGDILKYTIQDPPFGESVGYAEVVWNNGWFLQFKGHEPEETDQEDLAKYTEIAGNKYENSDLLRRRRK